MNTGVVTFIGIFIVAVTSFTTQLMWMRTTTAQMRRDHRVAARAELIEALRGFIEAAKVVELIAEQRFLGRAVPKGSGNDTRQMWTQYTFVDIIVSDGLQKLAYIYALRLSNCMWKEMPERVEFEDFIGSARGEFLRAVRVELKRPEFQ